MRYVFGPVPSRRLGQSLGIDPIPLKTCNWNCVYCQLGRTSQPTNERREYVPADEILAEVAEALRTHGPGAIDWITFVGSGEPTLHTGLGPMIRRVKALAELPVAVITNGSLLDLPEVRDALMAADAVLPTLDAGTDLLYRRINRPMAELGFDRLVRGLIAFRRQYRGRLWVEVMLIRGLNDSEEALRDLATVLEQIRPDQVHLNLPVRVPCEPWVAPADAASLGRARAILGPIAQVVPPSAGALDLTASDDVEEAIVAIVTRHPLAESDLIRALDRWDAARLSETLEHLLASGRVQVLDRSGRRFWSSSRSRYVDEQLSRHHGGRSSAAATPAGPIAHDLEQPHAPGAV
jgi:wyosine [tRNA(Phe)-imidazoG37] synthetase (radical SAM superfamily)